MFVRFLPYTLMAHRRSIGTVFQAYNLFPHLTALQNITLPLEKVHHYEPAEARQLAGEILEGGAPKLVTEMSDAQLLDLVKLDVNTIAED